MKIERERWIIVKNNKIFCGLARCYVFKPIDNIGNTAIKTYLSKKKAESSFVSSWRDGEDLLKNGEAKAIKVIESLIAVDDDSFNQIREIKTGLSEMKTRYQDGMEAIREGCDESDEILCPVCRASLACNDDDEELRPKHCPECGTKILY